MFSRVNVIAIRGHAWPAAMTFDLPLCTLCSLQSGFDWAPSGSPEVSANMDIKTAVSTVYSRSQGTG